MNDFWGTEKDIKIKKQLFFENPLTNVNLSSIIPK